MKIAVSADHHLTSPSEHPERFETLEILFRHVLDMGIRHLIIAGDCFDTGRSNYGDWDQILKRSEYRELQIHLVPGNHDATVKQASFAAPNVQVYSHPEMTQFNDLMSLPVLLIPYRPDCTMGDVLAESRERLKPHKWILIGHGDWSDGLKTGNPLEPGIYMPLSRSDIETYQPCRVVLGHIHKPMDMDRVHYPGSPCPLDITETGRRRYLILDTETGAVQPVRLDSERLHFSEEFVLVPGPKEWDRVKSQIKRRIETWRLDSGEKEQVRIRMRFAGYTSDKSTLERIVHHELKGYRYYHAEGPDLSRVSLADDPERSELFKQVCETLRALDFYGEEIDPTTNDILLKAMHTIYEV